MSESPSISPRSVHRAIATWAILVATAVGYLGVGMTIASLARTQRMASMGALCYMLTVALLLFITQRFGIPSV